MIRRAILATLTIVLFTNCQKSDNPTTDPTLIQSTITVGQPTTRIDVTPDDNDEYWVTKWQQNDNLGGYTVATSSFLGFSIAEDLDDDATSAKFSGEVLANSTVRFVYPYESEATIGSDGLYPVDMKRQSIDLSAPYSSMGAEKMYMFSDKVEFDSDGVAQQSTTMHHAMAMLEITFTPPSNINTSTYSYELVGLKISSSDDAFFTKGYLDLLSDDPQFVNGTGGDLYIDIENSPELSKDDSVVIPIVVAPTTLEYVAYVGYNATFSFYFKRTTLSSGVSYLDRSVCIKSYVKGDIVFEAGTYNTIAASGGDFTHDKSDIEGWY